MGELPLAVNYYYLVLIAPRYLKCYYFEAVWCLDLHFVGWEYCWVDGYASMVASRGTWKAKKNDLAELELVVIGVDEFLEVDRYQG